MGALCVQKTQYNFNENTFKVKKVKSIQDSYMAQIIKSYTNFYGRPVTKETEDFLQKNYEDRYYSIRKKDGVNQTGTYTYRDEITRKLQEAHKNSFKTYSVQFQKAQEQNGRLWYNWSISTKSGKVNYRCYAEFYYQSKKLFRQTFTILANTQIPKYMFQQPKTSYNFSSSNNISYQRPPQRFDGDAYVRQQNAIFRANMNKQAQQWNNYVTQKNNRGW